MAEKAGKATPARRTRKQVPTPTRAPKRPVLAKAPPTAEEVQDVADSALRTKKRAHQRALRGL